MIEQLTEALHLMQQALALLDAAGNLTATPHLDFAVHQVAEALHDVGVEQRPWLLADDRG